MLNSSKDHWDKIASVGALVSGILIPLAIALAGNHLSATLKESENKLKYIEIAASLIREEPKPENAALRDWAIDILAKHSTTVPLSPEAQAELKVRRVPISASGWGNTIVDNSTIPVSGVKR